MSVAIIDYGSGNLRSAEKAVESSLQDRGLCMSIQVSSCPDHIAKADHIILPGVGAFGDCIERLRSIDGMVEALEQTVIKKGRPFLGICVGMQLMATVGHEHGDHEGLGWIKGQINPLSTPLRMLGGQDLKVPHMGWNQLEIAERHKSHPVLGGILDGDHVYFVHSYQYETADPDHVMMWSEYGDDIPAMIGRDNLVGTQFHPEKSQEAGLRLIGNFLQWYP